MSSQRRTRSPREVTVSLDQGKTNEPRVSNMSVIKLAISTMDGKCEMNLRGIIKTSDTSKYNLRCNRNISEKMTKKDFIYDIRRPISGTRKLVEGQKRQIVLPIQLRRKTVPDSKMPQYTVITTKNDNGGGGDAGMMPEKRDLRFECNFCREPIATLLSLSTHVKFHCQKYCKMCYWILREDETMDQHIENSHRIRPGITVNL